ncbi:ABC transporter substrate-binding protein [Glycomyces sp. TRM65418]|uniref:ABC transporter substrate-binding protein n=1 Tax=Glycomyces sp. TRM65418 TaxID=2867006 RepID=UPI001CE537D3|nr:ABC transporter substrate-binding protein [Glycomyces sp. TRM65418]MCC3761720.1 ABC transporter substrate-binding protein [Glycomyces sp. TRM65418]QZD55807.1 ABC transporter substrate-binding protein [Glycomyces sp. TRM65418]
MPLHARPPAPGRLSRRGLFAVGGGLGAASVLAACGPDADAGDEDGGASGSFSFVDERDQTAVELDRIPSTVVAFTGLGAALYDYGVEVAAVFGPTTLAGGSPDIQAGRMPVDGLTVLGNAWGEFDVEQYAQLNPELLVSHYYDGFDLWFVPEERLEEVESLAPGIGIEVSQPALDQIIDRHAALAQALGADLSSDENVAGIERFGAAMASISDDYFEVQMSTGHEYKAMAVGAWPDGLYVADPSAFNLLAKSVELGVDFVVPENPDQNGYWELLSWENVDKYEADVIFLDRRTGNIPAEELLAEYPTWAALPAVAAGQVYSWNAEPVYSHVGGAVELEAIAEGLATGRPLRFLND